MKSRWTLFEVRLPTGQVQYLGKVEVEVDQARKDLESMFVIDSQEGNLLRLGIPLSR